MDGVGSPENGLDAGAPGRRWGWMPPLAWIVLVMLLSANGLRSMAPFAFDTGLPDGVLAHVRTGMAVAAVNLLWGAWLLAAAHARNRTLRRGFIVWQVFNLVAIAGSLLQIATVEAYVATASTFALPAIEFAIGVAMIVYARRLPVSTGTLDTAAAGEAAESPRTSALTFVNAAIGAVVGTLVGGLAGLGLGIVSIDLFDVSCFEGACGYFAVGLALAGAVSGAIAGIVFAVMLARRRSR